MDNTGIYTGSPVYRDLAKELRKSIEKGHHTPGERVASEHELARQHNLARNTVRMATELLVTEGLLERRPGKGLYVREKSTSTGVLKIMVGNLAWEPSVRIVRGAQQVARERGFDVQVCDAHGDQSQDVESVARLPNNGTAGAIIVSVNSPAFLTAVGRLGATGFPFVLVDEHGGRNANVPSVAADNYQGGFMAGTRIMEAGHRVAAFIGDAAASTVTGRLNGFRDALAEFGVALPRGLTRDIVAVDPFADWGELVQKECQVLLRMERRPTAIFCSCDAIARVCYRCCAEARVSIPEEMSVVGFDDDPMAEWLSPGLTTVRQPFADMGACAMRTLAGLLSGEASGGHQALPVEFIERGSLGKPAGK